MKHLKVLFMFAVFAATGMLAGCDTGLAGSAVEEQEGAGNPAPDAGSSAVLKKIRVKFVVCNGGWGLVKTEGIVSTADDNQLVYDSDSWSKDFDISILADEADDYVNIRWVGTDALYRKFWVKGKMPVKAAGRYAVVLDFNEEKTTDGWDVDTQNLDEVYKYGPGGAQDWLPADWDEAKSRSVADVDDTFIIDKYGTEEADDYTETPGASGLMTNLKPPIVHPGDSPTRMIKVKFEILTGGWGLDRSKGIVSLQDDSILVWDGVGASGDYTITIDVPVEDPYLNIRWKGDYWNTYYYAKAKLKLPPEDKTIPISGYTITIDFNHAMFGSKWSIGTKKLYDVTTWKNDDTDWKEAIEHAAKDKEEDY